MAMPPEYAAILNASQQDKQDDNILRFRPNDPGIGRLSALVGAGDHVDLVIVPATKDERMLCVSKIFYAIQKSTNEADILSSYFSLIIMVLPPIRDAIMNALLDCGFTVSEIHYDQNITWDIEQTHITEHLVTQAELMVALGLFFIIPFKNSSAVNHHKYYSARARALCGRLGVDANTFGILLDVDPANYIKSRLARSTKIKRIIIQIVTSEQAGREELLGPVLDYVWEIISYSDMSPYFITLNVLVRSGSPVLHCGRVANEVHNFIEAAKAVNDCRYPEFFRYLADSEEVKLIHKNRFPTLYATAIAIMSLSVPNIRNLVGVQQIDTVTVETMVQWHITYVTTSMVMNKELVGVMPEFLDPHLYDATVNMRTLNISKTEMETAENMRQFRRSIAQTAPATPAAVQDRASRDNIRI